MASDSKGKSNRIPIKFVDAETDSESNSSGTSEEPLTTYLDPENVEVQPDITSGAMSLDNDESVAGLEEAESNSEGTESSSKSVPSGTKVPPVEAGGPEVAELVATRAELKRVESEVAELKDRLARRQAEFENYRKRIDRERAETYERAVADVTLKLLPVVDNLRRALDTEASVEAIESDEFRHFLSGVDLIDKQLNGVLETLGVTPVSAVGERFDPHVHEAVVTEESSEHEPDTVIQEIVRGYKLGDKLIRPSLVKVAIKN